MLEFNDEKIGKAALVSVKGRIDNTSATLFEAHCNALVEKGDTTFVFDMGELQFLSSAGLRAILALAKKAKAAGGKLVFTGIKGPVKEVFELSGFLSMFVVSDTLEEAAGEVL